MWLASFLALIALGGATAGVVLADLAQGANSWGVAWPLAAAAAAAVGFLALSTRAVL